MVRKSYGGAIGDFIKSFAHVASDDGCGKLWYTSLHKREMFHLDTLYAGVNVDFRNAMFCVIRIVAR